MFCEDLEDLNVTPSMASKFLDRVSLMVELRRRLQKVNYLEFTQRGNCGI
jgi:hypothetical protein